MRLIVTKCDWGMDYLGDLEQRLKAFADAGYDGVECFFVAMDPGEFVDQCQSLGLEFNAGMVAPTVEAFRLELERSLELNPSLINCHAGRDYYDFDEGVKYFREKGYPLSSSIYYI